MASDLIDIVCFPNEVLSETKYTVEKLVTFLTQSRAASSLIIRGPTKSLFLVCAVPIDESSKWSLDKAVSQVEKVIHFHHGTSDAGFLFRAPSGVVFSFAVSRLVAESTTLLSAAGSNDVEKVEDNDQPAMWNTCFTRRLYSGYQALDDEEKGNGSVRHAGRRLVRYLALALLVFFLLSLSAIFLPQQQHPWQRFSEVIGSTGPQYQLQLKPDNVTRWLAHEHDVMDSKWFLRIDDGSIYPKELLEDVEVEYQAWLHERYPEVSAVKTTGRYLEPEYLSHPEVNDMIIDKYFHISHCVHSMRRYWVAKETGHHICPMDLSNWHMNHCFNDILLPWALPSGRRGTVPEGFGDATPYNISWVTRVCF